MRLWRYKAPRFEPSSPAPVVAEGEKARERTEKSVETQRETREEVAPMLAWLRRDYERNHYAEAVATVFRGSRR